MLEHKTLFFLPTVVGSKSSSSTVTLFKTVLGTSNTVHQFGSNL
jgi:hypothetical protein